MQKLTDSYSSIIQELQDSGFAISDKIYSDDEVEAIIQIIDQADAVQDTFRKAAELYAIRQFLKVVPSVVPLVFNANLRDMIQQVLGEDYFVVKSIYFDKPAHSNWFVASHQDLSISVEQKIVSPDFSNWTVKQGQYGVQPPLDFLEQGCTIRIHLDDTDLHNGALHVIAGSHLNGIQRIENLEDQASNQIVCDVPRAALMLMKPLLFHRSSRSTNGRQRRVIHLEFAKQELPHGLQWAERMSL